MFKYIGSMVATVILILWAVAWIPAVLATNIVKRVPGRRYYTLHVPRTLDTGVTQQEAARHVADTMGLQFEGQVGELQSYYWVSTRDDAIGFQRRSNDDVDPIIAMFDKYKHGQLHKRGLDNGAWAMVQRIDAQIPRKRVKRAAIPDLVKREPPVSEGAIELALAQKMLGINDPGFENQWHLINQKEYKNDLNVTGVWLQGITGNGTVVAILDDGLDYESRDLADNFFAAGSYDFNDHTILPTPRLSDDNHGTRCAGQIAAQRNDICGVGIAYNAKVAGIRILSAEISDGDEAAALNYRYQENDIFSCSWGPADDGQSMEAPTGILADAFINGVENGRGGKGTIYVFATGNGAIFKDNCNFDGYTNSIYTITVGAIDHLNAHPPYAESCSAQMVVTYSSGGGKSIFTTDRGENSCTDKHGGTSAAAPSAAGVFALVLSVRPDLTWRDMQHLCVQTAIPVSLDDEDWKKLPSGRIYNHKFGYGRLDAYAIVEAAKTFVNVNPQTHLILPAKMEPEAIPDSSNGTRVALTSTITVNQEFIQGAGLLRLEHVTATVNIEHQRRGDIVITLKSPNDVESELATARPEDKSPDGIQNWKFMSVKHWEENPVGNWTLFVYDVAQPEARGSLQNWTLSLFGELDPAFKGQPVYNPEASHDLDTHHELPSSTVESTSGHADVTPDPSTQDIPARPTRLKPSTSTTLSSASAEADMDANAESAAEQENSAGSGKGSTVYFVMGSVVVLALATGAYVQKHKSWRFLNSQSPPQPSGYEFHVLRGSDTSEGEHSDDHDNRPLLRNQQVR